MLACRGVDFSYGQLQVLFDVDFTVDDGEMVALLGTNGAGKSTLLKVDLRHRPAEQRQRALPRPATSPTSTPSGGCGSASPRSPVAARSSDRWTSSRTCAAFGYTTRRKDRRVGRRARSSECFEAFPRLHERRNSLAATLSGGEQQMLGLSKALILQPELLLIDELSLGLAPVIVGQLLDMVRQINADGTAVVLVEQSREHRAEPRRPRLLHGEGRDALRRPRRGPAALATTCCARCSSTAREAARVNVARKPVTTGCVRDRGRRGAVGVRVAGARHEQHLQRSRESPLPVILLGTIIGMTYGLLAVGLVLIYRTNRIINFAHGQIGAFGGGVLRRRRREVAHPVLGRVRAGGCSRPR